MTIDVHTHYFPEIVADMLRARTKPPSIERRDDGSEWFHAPAAVFACTPDYLDMAARLEFMDATGVDAQLLSFAGLFGVDSLPVNEALPILQAFNDHAATLYRDHPARFGPLASIPFDNMEAAVEEYRRARTELGLLGAVLPLDYFVNVATAERLHPIFAIADELGGHLFIHPGPRPDQRTDLAEDFAPPIVDNALWRNQVDVQGRVAHAMLTLLMTDLLTSYSGFSLHVANLGGALPSVIERMDHMRDMRFSDIPLPSETLRGLYVDCSSFSSKTVAFASAFLGADRVLLGTDCPVLGTERTLAGINAANLIEEEKHLILHGNAVRLLAPIWPEIAR